MVFQGLDKLVKLPLLSGLPKWGNQAPDDSNKEKTPVVHRMRNIFAAPMDYANEGLEDLKSLINVIPKSGETTELLHQAFEQHFVLQHLSKREQNFLISAMNTKTFAEGTTIIEQGQKGEYLYVIQEGTVKFVVDGVEQASRGEKGDVFGELSLLYDCPTAATVIAETECKTLRVSQFIFRRIKAAYALEGDKEKRDTIVKIAFFKDLPNNIIYQLADALTEREFKQGEVLVKKGAEATTMFILKQGWIKGTDISVGSTKMADLRLGPGEHFGEIAIVKEQPAAGNCVAMTDGTAWTITKERFQQTLGHLNLEESMMKSQDKKYLAALPLFAYSDVDPIETELMADKIQDSDYKKGHVFAKKGDKVVPALFIIRSGSVSLADHSDTKTLKNGEVFGFGGQTLILTNKLQQRAEGQHSKFSVQALLTQNQLYACEDTLKANRVPATHTVTATDDVKVGMLTLTDIAKILHDPLRIGRRPGSSAKNAQVTTDTLEKRKVLGAGTFGTVWLTRHPASDRPYALKVQYKRQLIGFNQVKGVIRETNIMSKMYHPFVMNIINSQQDATCLYMVMDFMQGGELGSVMHTRKRKHLAEGSSRFYAAGVLEGLSYMHRRHYIYRDLKGENVLLDNDGYAVIIDLGFAKFVTDKTFTFCGTPLFIAPEVILSKGHNKSADIWSYGVLLYEMLTGENPFYTEDMDQLALFKAICKGKYSWPIKSNASLSSRLLVEKLLVVAPVDRLGCQSRADLDIRDMAWFDGFDWGALYRKELTPPWKPVVKNPFDGSNFGNWSDQEKDTHKDLKPLSNEEQQLFAQFGR